MSWLNDETSHFTWVRTFEMETGSVGDRRNWNSQTVSRRNVDERDWKTLVTVVQVLRFDLEVIMYQRLRLEEPKVQMLLKPFLSFLSHFTEFYTSFSRILCPILLDSKK